jgi:transcriptional antiterminator RfaH
VVSDQIIESLRRRADCDTGLHCSKAPLFVPGDTVIIDEGPLSGVESIYLAQTGPERVVVLLQLLGRENHVRIERNLLRVG